MVAFMNHVTFSMATGKLPIQVELACLDQLLGLLGKNTLFWEQSQPSEYGYLYHVVSF